MKEKSFIQTRHGRSVHVFDPQPEEFDIRDIAYALSMQCRFNGHIKQFYSVAQHSVYVSRAAGYTNVPQARLWGLMHDASEAYIGDMPTPVKKWLPDFCAVEKNIEDAICLKFGIERTPEIQMTVKECDRLLLVYEAKELHPYFDGIENWEARSDITGTITRLDPKFYAWPPEIAQMNFLKEFVKVTDEDGYIRYRNKRATR